MSAIGQLSFSLGGSTTAKNKMKIKNKKQTKLLLVQAVQVDCFSVLLQQGLEGAKGFALNECGATKWCLLKRVPAYRPTSSPIPFKGRQLEQIGLGELETL